MRVLFFTEYGSLNGGEFSFLTALPFLQQAGFEFVAAVPEGSDLAKLLQSKDVTISPFSVFDGDTRKPLPQIRAELEQLIGRESPELVHANSLSASRIAGPVVASSVPKGIGYIRDIFGMGKQAISDVIQMDRIVCVSQAAMDFHVQRGMDAERLCVIHNGVDLERFKPVDRSGLEPVCLCIGQIGMRKGVELTLRLFRRICDSLTDARLLIVGERHSQKDEAIAYEQQLHDFARENFSDGQVQWLGRRTDVPGLMQKAKLLIHCAKQEPLGRVLLEAAASGLPVVTTNVGGTPEILQGLEEMMFSPQEIVERGASRAAGLLLDPTKSQLVSKQLREIAEGKFASELAARGLLKCYTDVVGAA